MQLTADNSTVKQPTVSGTFSCGLLSQQACWQSQSNQYDHGVRTGCSGHVSLHKQTNKQSIKQTDRQTNRQTDKQTDKQTNKPTNQPTNKQTNKQTSKQVRYGRQCAYQGQVGCRLAFCHALLQPLRHAAKLVCPSPGSLFHKAAWVGACQRSACFHDGVVCLM